MEGDSPENPTSSGYSSYDTAESENFYDENWASFSENYEKKQVQRVSLQ